MWRGLHLQPRCRPTANPDSAAADQRTGLGRRPDGDPALGLRGRQSSSRSRGATRGGNRTAKGWIQIGKVAINEMKWCRPTQTTQHCPFPGRETVTTLSGLPVVHRERVVSNPLQTLTSVHRKASDAARCVAKRPRLDRLRRYPRPQQLGPLVAQQHIGVVEQSRDTNSDGEPPHFPAREAMPVGVR
jgi:hypothetical protein